MLLVGALLCMSTANAQAAPDVTFTLTTNSPDGRGLVPKLTWAATPALTGTPCAASGATDWTGPKAASGSVTLAAVTASRAYTLVCTWPGSQTFTVTWNAPTTNTDGTPYTDPNGFRIQWGRTNSEAGLDQSFYLSNSAARSWVSPVVAVGAWYSGVRAVNSLGIESAMSNIVPKSVTADASVTRTQTLGFRVPSPPTGVN